jgi:transglutaminase-like putative cysteine protease
VIYSVLHRTTYAYEDPVSFARCVLRLTPRASLDQTVLESAVSVSPTPAHCLERIGPFGARTQTITIEEPHDRLVIEARALVQVHARPNGDPAASPEWGLMRAEAFATSAIDPDSPATFLYPTARTPLSAEITDYARKSFPPGRPIIEATADLMGRLNRDFAYDTEATDVATPVAAAFAARRGVCQDFAHIMIAGLRGLGLAAAYVSGYLRTVPPPGQPRLEGADATHAWVAVWCGADRGWVGFDPTNAMFAQDDHIELAVGRDYADVAPIDGVLVASGEQALKVEVDVTPIPESGVVRPRFGGRAG